MTGTHENSRVPQLLGAHVLGVLEEAEVREVEDHLATCPTCRDEVNGLKAMEEALGEVPPEALLDGPPDGGDLLLRRALRQVGQERQVRAARRRAGAGVAAAAVVAVVLGGGFAVGRGTAPTDDVAITTPTPVPSAPPSGTRLGTGTDPATGARMTVQVKPAAGWVRVNASVAGIAQGEQCRIVVVAKDGSTQDAGSWLVSEAGEKDGTTLDGSALVAPEDVAAVEVRGFDGRTFVSIPV
ncbi:MULTISPECIES: anti-sigma factor [Actinosynnema]|uniref:anti-sigma factor family protein n=1 Tax=Actinosynnema TaxID=40566 RepID=UPI0020A368FE|nr:zf-HC2 domain-containing protein [Actinosynnema pretiosum]MCP2098340.1 putative zinc-finger [Actinosynnema pretiosum]